MTRNRISKKGTDLIWVSIIILLLICEPALADLPFASGTRQLGNDIESFLAPLAGIMVLALGIGALAGKVNWYWAVAIIVGIIFIFGHEQIVTYIRAIFGI